MNEFLHSFEAALNTWLTWPAAVTGNGPLYSRGKNTRPAGELQSWRGRSPGARTGSQRRSRRRLGDTGLGGRLWWAWVVAVHWEGVQASRVSGAGGDTGLAVIRTVLSLKRVKTPPTSVRCGLGAGDLGRQDGPLKESRKHQPAQRERHCRFAAGSQDGTPRRASLAQTGTDRHPGAPHVLRGRSQPVSAESPPEPGARRWTAFASRVPRRQAYVSHTPGLRVLTLLGELTHPEARTHGRPGREGPRTQPAGRAQRAAARSHVPGIRNYVDDVPREKGRPGSMT